MRETSLDTMKAVQAMYRQLNKNKLKDDNGFSLVETLLVLLLIFTIVALTSVILMGSENASRDVISIVKSEIDARTALYRISKDIRETHYIKTAGDNEVIFESNIDSDEYFEEINYYTVSEDSHYNLYRQVDSETAKLIIENIVNYEIFNYFTDLGIPEDGMDTSTSVTDVEVLKDIKYIDINISIDQSGSPSLRTMDLNTIITLRNRLY
jgi:competence protein ComGC